MLSAKTCDILALCALAAIGSLAAVRVMLMMRKWPITPLQSFLFAVNYTLGRVLWRTTIHGRLPRTGADRGAVIVCNHRCPLDPSFIALTGPRVIHWMVAREYCDYFWFRGLLKACGAIPVKRGETDTAAAKEAIRLLQRGELVGIFPEGRINTTERLLLPGRPGAALLALKARVPVIPCYIDGAPYDGTTLGCLTMPARVRLIIGNPIDLSRYYAREGERKVIDELSRRFLCAIAQLAGRPDYRPELAGRSANTLPANDENDSRQWN
ncbi:MAG: 1-acyl-sn-glycerol-3-phosphate acyltransferase [Pirellulales bacterium]|nr:1-acyl-sn-glycerol-3-phosphate acyltransferase [Pirellulales bacterium]